MSNLENLNNVIDICAKISESDLNNPLLTKEVLLRVVKAMRKENDTLIQENDRLEGAISELVDFALKAEKDSCDIVDKIGIFCDIEDPTDDQGSEMWDELVGFSLKANEDAWEAVEYIREFYGIEDTPDTESETGEEEVRS